MLIPIWNSLVHEQNEIVREECHSALAYMVSLLSRNQYPDLFRDLCLPLQSQAITDQGSINILSSIFLKAIDDHEKKNISALELLDEDLETTIDSINSCHVYQSWSEDDILIAQSTLSILENQYSIDIYNILVHLAQLLIDNPTNVKITTLHLQFLVKFCTDRSTNPNFTSYVSSLITLEPKLGYVKQMIDGLNSINNFVSSGTKLKVDLVAKIKKLNRILVI